MKRLISPFHPENVVGCDFPVWLEIFLRGWQIRFINVIDTFILNSAPHCFTPEIMLTNWAINNDFEGFNGAFTRAITQTRPLIHEMAEMRLQFLKKWKPKDFANSMPKIVHTQTRYETIFSRLRPYGGVTILWVKQRSRFCSGSSLYHKCSFLSVPKACHQIYRKFRPLSLCCSKLETRVTDPWKSFTHRIAC